jgi:MtN3 and saliva related transmembrane protein
MDVDWEIVGLMAAILTSMGFIPQIIKGFRTRRMDDVSREMLVVLMLGMSLWFLYGLHLKNNIIVGANLFAFSSLLLTFMLKMRYSKQLNDRRS